MQEDLSRSAKALLLLLALVAWFGTLEYRRLIKPDEGRYAEISREMAASGDWLTPRLNGIKYFEKPPLQYWTTAAAYRVFGLHEWTARLWTALTGFLTVLVVWAAGRRLFGPAAGNYAAMVLISNVYFVVAGHVNSLDMGLAFFTTLALAGFCLTERHLAGSPAQRAWMLAVWAAMALAVLSKGLIGIVFPGMTLLAYSIAMRDRAAWRRLALLPGALLFLAIAAPWFVAVSVVNPEFPWFFFVHEHFLRYSTDAGRRPAPVYYFAVVLALGMLPWTLVMLEALWRAARRLAARNADRTETVLLLWIAVVFVFFSISKSKLPSYILPLFPAVALLMGRQLAALEPRGISARIVPLALLALPAAFLVAAAPRLAADPILRPLVEQYAYWLYAALLSVVLGAAFCWRQVRRRNKQMGVSGFCVASLAAALLILNGHDSLAPSFSAHDIAQKVRPLLPPGVPFYSVRAYDQTLPFYLRRTVTLVDFRDELDYGLRQEPGLAIASIEEFRRRWSAHERAYAMTTPEQYAILRRDGIATERVAEDGRRVVFRKPEATQ